MGFLKTLDLVVDVETIGIYKPGNNKGKKMVISNAIFNIGLVLSYQGQILLKESIAIEEFWDYPEHRIMDFYRSNFDKDGGDFTVLYQTMQDFLQEYFYPLLKSFKGQANIKLWSYNAGFDSRAFRDTAKLEEHIIPKPIMENWKCLMVLASELLSKDVKYLNWLVANEYQLLNHEYISAKGNLKIKAETVFRYITQDSGFIEAHKGLDDALIETKILNWVKAQKGWSKIDASPEGGSWQLLNNKALPFQRKSHLQGVLEENGAIQKLLTIENQQKLDELVGGGHFDWQDDEYNVFG